MAPESGTEQIQLKGAAIEFARGNLSHGVIERDREAGFDRKLWQQCAEFGMLAMPIPQKYGGMGLGLTAMIGVMEILDRAAQGQSPPEFFSTHPKPANRVEYIKKLIEHEFPNGVPDGLEK